MIFLKVLLNGYISVLLTVDITTISLLIFGSCVLHSVFYFEGQLYGIFKGPKLLLLCRRLFLRNKIQIES